MTTEKNLKKKTSCFLKFFLTKRGAGGGGTWQHEHKNDLLFATSNFEESKLLRFAAAMCCTKVI